MRAAISFSTNISIAVANGNIFGQGMNICVTAKSQLPILLPEAKLAEGFGEVVKKWDHQYLSMDVFAFAEALKAELMDLNFHELCLSRSDGWRMEL